MWFRKGPPGFAWGVYNHVSCTVFLIMLAKGNLLEALCPRSCEFFLCARTLCQSLQSWIQSLLTSWGFYGRSNVLLRPHKCVEQWASDTNRHVKFTATRHLIWVCSAWNVAPMFFWLSSLLTPAFPGQRDQLLQNTWRLICSSKVSLWNSTI